jgi:putative ABC transport system permease protein
MLYQKRQRLRAAQPSWWSLAGLQYTAVTVLIIWGFMIYRQVEFILSKDLGFNYDNVIVIDAPMFKNTNFHVELEGFKNTLTAIPGVQDVTQCTSEMSGSYWDVGLRKPGGEFTYVGTNGSVDENFLQFFKVPLVAGRNPLAGDSAREIVISEGTLSHLNFTNAEDAIGTELEVDQVGGDVIPVHVVGVFKGYRIRPMLRFSGAHGLEADPGVALFNDHRLKQWFTVDKILLRVNEADVTTTMAHVATVYKSMFPGNVFHWTFLDENINRHYVTEKVWRNQILIFTCIAIGIACLGLLGMISNRVLEKTKEIGIRKILGAQIYQIALILISTTARHLTLAIMVGIPLAYLLTQQYLEKFSERIAIQWWHVVIPILLLIILMCLTISSVLWKAAKSNPVDALKHE